MTTTTLLVRKDKLPVTQLLVAADTALTDG